MIIYKIGLKVILALQGLATKLSNALDYLTIKVKGLLKNATSNQIKKLNSKVTKSHHIERGYEIELRTRYKRELERNKLKHYEHRKGLYSELEELREFKKTL